MPARVSAVPSCSHVMNLVLPIRSFGDLSVPSTALSSLVSPPASPRPPRPSSGAPTPTPTGPVPAPAVAPAAAPGPTATAAGTGTAAATAAAAASTTPLVTSLAPSIPVRHTIRTKHHARQATANAAESAAIAAAAAAAQSAAASSSPATAAPSPVADGESVDDILSHFGPLLAARRARLADVQQRLDKQSRRLHALYAWKSARVAEASARPHEADMVLAPEGQVRESKAVRTQRLVLQRVTTRSFVRACRLTRALAGMQQQLQALLPLLLDDPHASTTLTPESREELQKARSWSELDLPMQVLPATDAAVALLLQSQNRRSSLEPKQVPLLFSRAGMHRGGDSPAVASAATLHSTASSSSAATPASVAPSPSSCSPSLPRPHAVSAALLARLESLLPAIAEGVSSTLSSSARVAQANLAAMQANTSEAEAVRTGGATLTAARERMEALQGEVGLIRAELVSLRRGYTESTDALATHLRNEASLLATLGRLYHQVVAESFGEAYATQLAAVQGRPVPTALQQQQQQQQQSSASSSSSSSAVKAAKEGEWAWRGPQAESTVPPLLLPSSILGTPLPSPPPPPPPHFLPHSNPQQQQQPHHSRSGSSEARLAMLRRVDALLALHPRNGLGPGAPPSNGAKQEPGLSVPDERQQDEEIDQEDEEEEEEEEYSEDEYPEAELEAAGHQGEPEEGAQRRANGATLEDANDRQSGPSSAGTQHASHQAHSGAHPFPAPAVSASSAHLRTPYRTIEPLHARSLSDINWSLSSSTLLQSHSQDGHDARACASSDHCSSQPPAVPVTPPPPAPVVAAASPVPGLSPSVYADRYRSTVRHLEAMGYDARAAREFAPHVVQVAAVGSYQNVQLAMGGGETPMAREGDEASVSPRRQQHLQQQRHARVHSKGSSPLRGRSITSATGHVYASALQRRPASSRSTSTASASSSTSASPQQRPLGAGTGLELPRARRTQAPSSAPHTHAWAALAPGPRPKESASALSGSPPPRPRTAVQMQSPRTRTHVHAMQYASPPRGGFHPTPPVAYSEPRPRASTAAARRSWARPSASAQGSADKGQHMYAQWASPVPAAAAANATPTLSESDSCAFLLSPQ